MYAFCCLNPNDDGQGLKMHRETEHLYFAVLTLMMMMMGEVKKCVARNITVLFCCLNPNDVGKAICKI